MRAVNVQYNNKGILWGEDAADVNNRSYMGIDNELHAGESKRYNIINNDEPLVRTGCGPMGADELGSRSMTKTLQVGEYVHALQGVIDEAGYDAPVIDITPTLAPYADEIRLRMSPW